MTKSNTARGESMERPPPTAPKASAHRGHGWMMIACSVPMIAIAVALGAAGVLSFGFLVFAVACTAMMVLMMRGMSGGKGHQH